MAVPNNIGTVCHDSGKSGAPTPTLENTNRFGVRQSSGALPCEPMCANVNMNRYICLNNGLNRLPPSRPACPVGGTPPVPKQITLALILEPVMKWPSLDGRF
jgi:hypothetical protein